MVGVSRRRSVTLVVRRREKEGLMSGRFVLQTSIGLVGMCVVLSAKDGLPELRNLEGTWQVTRLAVTDVVIDRDTPPGDVLKQTKLVVSGNRMTYFLSLGTMKTEIAWTITAIDPTKTPKTIDGRLLTGPNKGTVTLGIYDLNGDILKLCFPDEPSTKRPQSFHPKLEGDSSVNVNFLTLRRTPH
jgi:uncharacterized protein (TIGR03067 family)